MLRGSRIATSNRRAQELLLPRGWAALRYLDPSLLLESETRGARDGVAGEHESVFRFRDVPRHP